MVGKKSTLKVLRKELHARHVTAIRTTEFAQVRSVVLRYTLQCSGIIRSAVLRYHTQCSCPVHQRHDRGSMLRMNLSGTHALCFLHVTYY
jgi:hypothetical protein